MSTPPNSSRPIMTAPTRHSLNLGTRFGLVMGGIVVVNSLVLVGGFLGVEGRYLIEEGRKNHRVSTEHLAHLCADSIVTRDQLALVNFIKELKRSTDLEEALCVDAEGVVLAHTDLGVLGRRLDGLQSPWDSSWLRESPLSMDRWVYSRSVSQAGLPVALARTTYSSRGVKRAVHLKLTQMARRSFGLCMNVVGVALLLAALGARALTRPLRKLAQGARRLSEGDWAARVPEDGPAELGDLAGEFNTMAERLGDLDRLKDSFINSVSHDLRNPLSAIATSAKMLRTASLPPASAPLPRIIETAAVRLRAMVNNILDTAKMRQGRLVFTRTVIEPRKLFEELSALYRPLAEKSKKTLVVDLPPDTPSLFADEEKVLRVFLNLLSNAFKFTREGDTISLSGRGIGKEVEFRVTDTGRGIAPRLLPNLFEPFRSVDGIEAHQGTGLGLSIVKALVEGHGGGVRVESAIDRGTVVIVTLPAAMESR